MDARIQRSIAELVRFAAIFALLVAGGTPTALAQSAFWSTTATTGGSWGSAPNWQGGIVPSGAGNAAGFVLDFTPGASVMLDGNRIIGSILSTAANPWSIDAGTGGTLTVASIVVTGGPLTVSTQLAGADFAKDGSGTLILSNPNSSYSGGININAGTLSLIGSANYSTASDVLQLASGATLDVTQLTGGFRYGGAPDTRMNVQGGDVLEGIGTVNGGLKVKSGGTVYPGINGVGTLTIDGKGLFETGSNWKVKLGTANAGSLNASNRLTFSAALTLETGTNMPIDGTGLTFTVGQTYDYLISSGASSFTIGAVNLQPINFDPSAFATPSSFSLIPIGDNLVLRFTPVPEPAFVLAICFGAATGISVLRRRSPSSAAAAGEPLNSGTPYAAVR
jgi:autotransporter-associated beta strand protein